MVLFAQHETDVTHIRHKWSFDEFNFLERETRSNDGSDSDSNRLRVRRRRPVSFFSWRRSLAVSVVESVGYNDANSCASPQAVVKVVSSTRSQRTRTDWLTGKSFVTEPSPGRSQEDYTYVLLFSIVPVV